MWQKPIIVTGKPGAGKTRTLCQSITENVSLCQNVLVASPTGFLASVFRSVLPEDVVCETVHASFKIPVNADEQPTINWAISHYDIVVIDEISMVSDTIFDHILSTLKRLLFRPILIVCGDVAQQQPFQKRANSTINVPSPLNNHSFLSSAYRYCLTGQHRVGDEEYLSFLDHIRNWVPQQPLLDQLQEGRVLCPNGVVDVDRIIQAFELNPGTTVLTFTNNAADQLNKLISSALFLNVQPLGVVQLDSDQFIKG